MQKNEIQQILERQRRFFHTGATLPVSWRREQLQKLYAAVQRNQEKIEAALAADLGKSRFEGFMCETGLTLSEIRYMQRHVRRFAARQRVRTPASQFPASSYRVPSPYGTVLIMSPWNYPLLLALDPLADALAAGNTVVLKPSAYAPATSALLEALLRETFPPELVAVVTGGRAENACLLEQRFDMIFFTGSQAVGREVLRHAAQTLTPVVLELGGKSPCIVDASADLPLAARRIVFGKFLNCGQTCVAPDYILCDAGIKDALLRELEREIVRQFGAQPLSNRNYGRIVNEKHFDRLCALLDGQKPVLGGQTRRETLQIAPTLLDQVGWRDAIMQEEIFGPLLPVLTYTDFDAVFDLPGGKPLALYLFSRDRAHIRQVTERCSFGGGCINDTIIHLATSEMGFGGVGESGMGAYHGRAGFEAFSHTKSIVDKKLWMDLPMRYQPYQRAYERLLHFFLR